MKKLSCTTCRYFAGIYSRGLYGRCVDCHDSSNYSMKTTVDWNETHKLNVDVINVIFNPPATIVFWDDGTKTVVKCQNDEFFDPEKGLAMAISKKAFGNEGNYYNQFNKWIGSYKPTIEDFIADLIKIGGDDVIEELSKMNSLLEKIRDEH